MRNLSIFALVLVAALAALPMPVFAQSGAAPTAREKGAQDAAAAIAASAGAPTVPASVSAVVRQRFASTLALLEASFPEDYGVLSADIDDIGKSGLDEKAAVIRFFQSLTELRRKYAYKLIDAPTVAHATILGHLATFYDRVVADEGPQVCGRFAHGGSLALLDLGLSAKYADLLDLQSFAYFDAVAKAISTPEFAGIAAARDWSFVMQVIVKAGMPRNYIAAIDAGDPTSADLCPAYSALFRATGVLDTAEGKRVRADLAKSAVGY